MTIRNITTVHSILLIMFLTGILTRVNGEMASSYSDYLLFLVEGEDTEYNMTIYTH